jgi:ABC-2 type transport system ATP-binding protein
VLSRVTGADAVIDEPERSAVAPTTDGVGGLADVARALADAGIEVEDLGLRQPTLDEVFLTLTGLPITDEDDDARAEEAAR